MFKIYENLDRSNKPGPETPVPVDTVEWEFNMLLELFNYEKPKRILEVGVYYGATLFHWFANAPDDASIVVVDSNGAKPEVGDIWEYMNMKNLKLLILQKEPIEDVASVASVESPFDFIFINSLKDYEDVKRDWTNFVPLIADSGIVAIHNIKNKKINKFWQEIQNFGYVTQEIVAFNSNNGIGIVYV